MDAAMNFYDQFVLDERSAPLGPPREDSWDLIRYPELCHEQRYEYPKGECESVAKAQVSFSLLFGSSNVEGIHSQEQDNPPNDEPVQPSGHGLNSAIDPKVLCMKLGGVYSSKEPRFYFSEREGKPVPVWIDSNVPVDWCRCDVKGLLEFTRHLHRTLEKANIWPDYQLKTLKEMDDIVISTRGPLGPEVVYPNVLEENPVAEEVDDALFRLLIHEDVLPHTVATRPPTSVASTGPPTPENATSADLEGEAGGETSSVESDHSSVELTMNQSAVNDPREAVTTNRDMPSSKKLDRLVVGDQQENHDETNHPDPSVLLEEGTERFAGTSMAADISIEMPTLTSKEVSQVLETGNWMDALGRFPKAQRPLTIVGQVAVKEYLDANKSIRLKPGKIDQDLKRMEKEAKEVAKATKPGTRKNPRTTIAAADAPSSSTKDQIQDEKRKRNRTLPPPDLTLRTVNGVVVPETITVCRAQVNIVGGKWLISRDTSCSMAIRASQEYRRHFVERHLGGQRPTKDGSPEVTLDPSPEKGDRLQSIADSNVVESVPLSAEEAIEPVESPVNIASDRVSRKGKRRYEDPDAGYKPSKRAKNAPKHRPRKGASATEAVLSPQDPSTEGSSSQTAIGDPSAEPGIHSATMSK